MGVAARTYVTRVVNGRNVDAKGNFVEADSPAAHIPIKYFSFDVSTPIKTLK